MTLFILNESQDCALAGDVGVYTSLVGVFDYVEDVDVLNGEYFLYDSDGAIISLELPRNKDGALMIRKVGFDPSVVRNVLEQYLVAIGRQYRTDLSLEENARTVV